MIKIGITGGSFHGNTGAEAMLITTIARLQESLGEVRFGVFSPYYNDDRLVFSDRDNIHLYDASPFYLAFVLFPFSVLSAILKRLGFPIVKGPFPKAVKYLAECDLILDIAGVSFIDSRKRFLPYNVLSIYPGFLFGKPVVKLAQAIGPIEQRINAFFARHCLKRCRHIFARGQQTYAHLEEFGLSKGNYSLAPDVAFAHDPADSLTTKAPSEVMEAFEAFLANTPPTPIIGICPSAVLYQGSHGDLYLQTLISTIQSLSARGFRFVIFPNASKSHKPNTMRNNDLPLLRLLKASLDSVGSCHLMEADLNASDIRDILRRVDLAVVSRFHAMIFSLLEHKLPVVVSWSHKYREVMDQFELGDLVLDHQSIDAERLTRLINDTLERSQELSNRLGTHLPSVCEDAKTQLTYAANLAKQGRI